MRIDLKGLLAVAALAASPAVANAAEFPSAPPDVSAIPVAYLIDTGSGRVLFARQPDLRFVPASMTKVMSAYVAFGLIASGKLREDSNFIVDPAIAREWNGKGTTLYLRGGERISVEMLLRGITTVSANDAAMVLATGQAGSVKGWTALMNTAARELGMNDSRFATPNGWPDNGATFVSAQDLGLLATAMIRQHPGLYHRYFGQKTLAWNGVTQTNKDPVIGVVAGADGIKTGYTREAGYNFLGSAQRDGQRLVMVIGGARSEAERAKAARNLLEWGFAAWTRQPLFAAGAEVGAARVQGGDARSVALVSPWPIHATLPRGQTGPIRLTLRYTGPLVAPIARGAQVAELAIADASGGESRVPLVAGESVGKAGLLDRLANGLYGLLP